MADLISIIIAIAFLLIILQIRAVLALPLRAAAAHRVQGDWSGLVAAGDVMHTLVNDYAPLGFRGPVWFRRELDHTDPDRLIAVLHHDDGVLLCVVPMFVAENPHRGVTFFATRLADGRTVVSQPADPFFATTATDEPAQTLHPAAPEAMLLAHRRLVQASGVIADDATSEAVMADIVGNWMQARLDKLARAGQTLAAADGSQRARLPLAWRMLRAYWSRPKWTPIVGAVPLDRQVLIAENTRRVRHRAPTAGHQWLLFALSVVLFLVLGTVWFDPGFAVILLVVIGIHEGGHYLAMRAFGYRNVQMLALPLVGGVTVGHETHPSATHRAWMSLMGPLPGVVIGWILLALSYGTEQEWLSRTAMVFLAVNYLNLIPVPPLDGGHIVQAMLPPRWYGLRIAFLVAACLIGIGAGLYFGLIGLTFIVALQLLGVPMLWQNRAAIRHLLAQSGLMPGQNERGKWRAALAALNTVAGAKPALPARINQAEEVIRSLDVAPMRWPARLVLSLVYFGLLLAPMGFALVLFASMTLAGFSGVSDEASAQAEFYQRVEAEVAALPRQELLAEYLRRADAETTQPVPAPADPAAIAATEQSLGQALPDDLRAIYALRDGVDDLPLGPVSEIGPLNQSLREELESLRVEGVIYASRGVPAADASDDAEMLEIRAPIPKTLWRIGGDDTGSLLLYDFSTKPWHDAGRVWTMYDYELGIYPDFDTFLRQRLVGQRLIAKAMADRQASVDRRRAALRGKSVDEMIESIPQVPLWMRLLTEFADHPAPASQAELDATAQRIGRVLPASMVAFYQGRNGLPMLGLAPLAQLTPVRVPQDEPTAQYTPLNTPIRQIRSSGAEAEWFTLSSDELAACYDLTPGTRDGFVSWPQTVWCPQHPAEGAAFIRLFEHRAFATFDDLLVDLVAETPEY